MILQMQDFFKGMNTICKVLNIGQPVLQIMTVLCFVRRVLKNDMKVMLLVQKLLYKTVIQNTVAHRAVRTRNIGIYYVSF